MVTHPGTNRVWRSATTLFEANALPLSQTANLVTELSLCSCIMYYYSDAQWYEQFLQVSWLDWALILLGLALSSKCFCVFCLRIYFNFFAASLTFYWAESGEINYPLSFSAATLSIGPCCCTPVSDIPSRRHLQSTTRHHLTIPRYRLSTFGRRAFSVAGLTVWNSLPDSLRDPVISSNNFRQSLKTNLFQCYHSAHTVQ